MASKLNEDRVCRKQGEPDAYEDYPVADGVTVHTNSLVGVRTSDGTLEPVDPASPGGYSVIGFTEDHVDAGDEDRKARVKFGYSVELDAAETVGAGDIGSPVFAASDHEVALSSSFDSDGDSTNETLQKVGVLRSTMGAATDRAMVDVLDITEQA